MYMYYHVLYLMKRGDTPSDSIYLVAKVTFLEEIYCSCPSATDLTLAASLELSCSHSPFDSFRIV